MNEVSSIEVEGPTTQQARQERDTEREKTGRSRTTKNNNKQSTEKETLNTCRNWLRYVNVSSNFTKNIK